MKPIAVFFILLFATAAGAQTPYQLRALTQAPVSSIRGLSVVTDSVVWVSGTEGKAGRSLNGGKSWEWFTIPGCDTCDFRDIEAFSAEKAIVMGIAEPARIYLTRDGGKNWEQVYFNDAKGMFLDGMDFRNEKEGVAVGDPIGGRFTLIRTRDGGESWQLLPGPEAKEGEAIFAASGTTLRVHPNGGFAFCTGGTVSRYFRYDGSNWAISSLPAIQGPGSAGIFSFAFRDGQAGVAVGGDYTQAKQTKQNCAITRDGGRSWSLPEGGPGGYRSAVEYIDATHLVATGPSGTDISANGGQNWTLLSEEGFHAVRKAKKGNMLYLAGSKGRIAVLERGR